MIRLWGDLWLSGGGKARVGAEGSEERTQVGGVREFKGGERRWVEAGVREERRRCVSSRWR